MAEKLNEKEDVQKGSEAIGKISSVKHTQIIYKQISGSAPQSTSEPVTSGELDNSEQINTQEALTVIENNGTNKVQESTRDNKAQPHHDVTGQNTDAESNSTEQEETEFVWDEYLDLIGASAAPPTAFKHVEHSLQSGFIPGMKLEVSNQKNPDSYWVASVIMTCGPLLRLRYDGYGDDRSADFWCEVAKNDIHPVGWCAQNSKALQPPEEIKDKYDNWSEFLVRTLTGASTVPSYLLEGCGTTPVEQIRQGMHMEVQDRLQPNCVWIARVLENVGGRLLMRYEGTDHATHDFWMFYLNFKLHALGWAKENDCQYKPPNVISFLAAVIKSEHSNYQDWQEILQKASQEAMEMPLPPDLFKHQQHIREHGFVKGMKLEALNPVNRTQICPATVVQVVSKHYFIIEIDDLREKKRELLQVCCHADCPEILPIHWCLRNGVRLTHPRGWNKTEFDWGEYLNHCNADAAPKSLFNLTVPEHSFERGMKLEAVNPFQPHQICAATITKIASHLMWIHTDSHGKSLPNHIVEVESHDIFPVGWCESNGYPLKPPRPLKVRKKQPMPQIGKKVAIVLPEKQMKKAPIQPLSGNKPYSAAEPIKSQTYSKVLDNSGGKQKNWCPKIYFNHKCFSGPYLSKGRIAELPKCVGPGPVALVIKEVLSMLISVAYKSSRVLRELQLDGNANPNMYQQVLKAKYKGKSYRAVVEICKNSEQVAEFCRRICIKLECCPNLFGPEFVGDSCPEDCSRLTKTKYTYYYGGKKKRKIGRPPGGHTNLENGPKKPGKRKKQKKTSKKKTADEDNDHDTADDKSESSSNVSESTGSTENSTENGDKKEDEEEDDDDEEEEADDDGDEDEDDDDDSRPPKAKRKYIHHIPPKTEMVTRGAKLPNFGFHERRKNKKHHHISSPSLSLVSPPPSQPPSPKPTSPLPLSHSIPVKAENVLKLESNPLDWTVDDVVNFIKSTDCSHMARLFREQEIDGQALLLLTLPTVQEHLELKLGPAIKLCHQIERVKVAFYDQYTK